MDDSPAQSLAAAQRVRDHEVFIPKSVLMESEWVLRHTYGFSREHIETFLRAVLDTSNTVVEDRPQLERAVEWYRQGADFADALHLATAGQALFHTFDRQFCKDARRTGSAPAVRVLRVLNAGAGPDRRVGPGDPGEETPEVPATESTL